MVSRTQKGRTVREEGRRKKRRLWVKMEEISQPLVAPPCNPSYLGGWDWKDHSLRPAMTNSSRDPHLQNKHSKMDWRCGSSHRESALQELQVSLLLPFSILQFFFLVVRVFELRASHLLDRCSTTWATPPALFCDGFF
jgi:hypothetical protein